MKKFYISTLGKDLKIFPTLTGVSANDIKMDFDKIYYVDSDKIEASQAVDQVSVFGTDAFNQLQEAISVTSIIDVLPIAPTDPAWYLIAHDVVYNKIVTITLDGAITGVIVDDSVVAENNAVGIVTVVAGSDLTIKYNGTAFSEASGSSEIHEGTVFDSTDVNIQDITDEDKVGPFVSTMTDNKNALIQYDSGATVPWKILQPFNGLAMTYDGNGYIWDNIATSDRRWKITPVASVTGNSILQTISVDLTAPAESTAAIDTSAYGAGVIQFDVATINTDVTMRAEGSNDGTNWFNLDASDLDTTYISNGTYAMTFNKKYRWSRLSFIGENGGTAVVIENITFFLTN